MEQINKRKYLFIDYCLLTFIILWSGGSISYGLFKSWPYVMTGFASIVLLKRGRKLDQRTIFIIGVFAIILLLQMAKFGGGITSVIAPILSIAAVAIIATDVRMNFNHVFITIITFLSLFSLVLWSIDMLPGGHNSLLALAERLPQLGGDNLSEIENSSWSNGRYTLYFYTVTNLFQESDFYSWPRNSGPFFEPGRFTVFLAIALALILYNKDFKKYRTHFLIIFIANITTFSTTGYFVMVVIFFIYLFNIRQSNTVFSVVFLLLLIVSFYYALQASFMGEKIASALGDTDNANSRFGAMIYHWTQIVQSPIIGFGNYLDKTISILELSPCGITDMIRRWGIPLFVFCVWLIYDSTRSYMINNVLLRLSFLIILLALAYTQTIMTSPLFYLFYFIGSKSNIYGEDS